MPALTSLAVVRCPELVYSRAFAAIHVLKGGIRQRRAVDELEGAEGGHGGGVEEEAFQIRVSRVAAKGHARARRCCH